MNELKPCPFCGAEAKVPEFCNGLEWTGCPNVRCSVGDMTTTQWNRRSPSPEHRNEVLELVVEKLQEARPYMMSTAGFTQKVVGFIEGIDKALAVVASLKSETKP